MNLETLEERLTLTASLSNTFAGTVAEGIHASRIVASEISKLSTQLGSGVSVTTVATSTTQALHGQAVVLTSTVSAAVPGGPAPTGNVTFFSGPLFLGTAPLVNGTATLSSWNKFLTGSNYVQAAYWGDANYAVSNSGLTDVQVSKTPSLTTLSTTASGQSVTFTATVAPAGPYAGTPTGVVAFYEDGTLVDSVLLVNGRATLTQAMNGSGNHTFTASYFGDSSFNPSATPTSTVQALSNQTSSPTPTVVSSQTALYARTIKNAHGTPIGLVMLARVTAPNLVHVALKGTVTFFMNGRAIWTSILKNGSAVIFYPQRLAAQGHTFTARYNGMNGVAPSTATVTI